jgi:ARG and Rhodanese-Phosphatase-superfamily-associated Protein domain
MNSIIAELVQNLEVTESQESNGLQVFGLQSKPSKETKYATMDEALGSQLLEISEIGQDGTVPAIRAINKSDGMVFLMAGEQLVGAKQNRVLNASIMVPARETLDIPVSCVEAGRWHHRSHFFGSHGTMSHGQLRASMSKPIQAAYLCAGTPMADQAAVWKEVSRKLGAMRSPSSSSDLYAAYEDHKDRLGEVVGKLSPGPNCCGVAFAIGGRIAGVDIFDQPSTLAKLWRKLVGAYALDALEPHNPGTPLSAAAVQDWLRQTSEAKQQQFKSPGLGHDVRLESRNLVGASLIVDDHPIHTELFYQDVVEPAKEADTLSQNEVQVPNAAATTKVAPAKPWWRFS